MRLAHNHLYALNFVRLRHAFHTHYTVFVRSGSWGCGSNLVSVPMWRAPRMDWLPTTGSIDHINKIQISKTYLFEMNIKMDSILYKYALYLINGSCPTYSVQRLQKQIWILLGKESKHTACEFLLLQKQKSGDWTDVVISFNSPGA